MMKNLHAEEQGWKVFSGLNIQHINKDLGKKKKNTLIFWSRKLIPYLWTLCAKKGFPITLNQYTGHLST